MAGYHITPPDLGLVAFMPDVTDLADPEYHVPLRRYAAVLQGTLPV